VWCLYRWFSSGPTSTARGGGGHAQRLAPRYVRENEASIREHGLRATYYGDNFQGFGIGTPFLTLFKDRSNAPPPGRDVVVVLHVPDSEAGVPGCG
jgi:hypothetical protein